MRRFRIPLLLLMSVTLLMLICCPADDDDDATGDDDSTGDDDVTGDDDDDATGDDDDDSFVPDQIDGYVQIQFNEGPDNAGGIASMGLIWANFFEIVSEPVPGYTLNEPDGVDECAYTAYTHDELTAGDPGEYTYQSAGTLSVTGGGGAWQVESFDPGSGYIFYQWPLSYGSDLQFDTSYNISLAGDTFPAFDAPGSIVMPEEFHLTSPTSADMVTLTGDLSVQWSGGGSGNSTLMVHAIDGLNYGDLICNVANDGEFTIPAAYTSQLPSGVNAELTLSRSVATYTEVEGRWVETAAVLGLSADGITP